ncbi:MAG: PEP-CTERM sorting domain-containing protein [Opitutaceae bacterium]
MKKYITLAVSALLIAASASAVTVVLDNFDGVDESRNGFRSIDWSGLDTVINNAGDTRGGQARVQLATIDASVFGFTDASEVQLTIELSALTGNEMHNVGKIMLADSADRRWIFNFDDFAPAAGSLGSAAASDQSITITSNATSARDLGQGVNDGSDFDWANVGKGVGSGEAYWIQYFDFQSGGGAHPVNLQFDSISIVPESSSYALIAGALALGAVMVRRRK